MFQLSVNFEVLKEGVTTAKGICSLFFFSLSLELHTIIVTYFVFLLIRQPPYSTTLIKQESGHNYIVLKTCQRF